MKVCKCCGQSIRPIFLAEVELKEELTTLVHTLVDERIYPSTYRYRWYRVGDEVECFVKDMHTGVRAKGVAKCSKDDVFDVATGKSISAMRANIELNKKNINFVIDNI